MKLQHYNPSADGGQFGVIVGEPNDVYHANDAISNSDLSLFIKNPKRFEALRNGDIEKESKACYTLGSLFHLVSLEGIEAYNERYVLNIHEPKKPTPQQLRAHGNFGNIDKPTKAQLEAFQRQSQLIEAYENFWKVHEGKESVRLEDDQTARAMRDSMLDDEDALEILYGFEEMHKELTVRTEKLKHGFSVQAKLDIYDEQTNRIIDLKSVHKLDQFRKEVWDFGYYRQAAFYSLVAELVFGKPIQEFLFIAVEASAPHEVGVFKCDEDFIAQGIAEIKAGLTHLGKCLKENSFPKRFCGVTTLFLESWEKKKSDDRMSRLERSVA
ncbi:MAG: PD-(D/E)XK nuclease-like domain-containing protein [Verrucomicrobiota bacterium]